MTEKRLDPMFTKVNKRSIAALERHRKLKETDPDFAARNGRKGGQAKVDKGFATMDKTKHIEVSAKGGKVTSKRKDDLKNKDLHE